jgi:hypothetical protein
MLNLNHAQKLIRRKLESVASLKFFKNIKKPKVLEVSIFDNILNFYLVTKYL